MHLVLTFSLMGKQNLVYNHPTESVAMPASHFSEVTPSHPTLTPINKPMSQHTILSERQIPSHDHGAPSIWFQSSSTSTSTCDQSERTAMNCRAALRVYYRFEGEVMVFPTDVEAFLPLDCTPSRVHIHARLTVLYSPALHLPHRVSHASWPRSDPSLLRRRRFQV